LNIYRPYLDRVEYWDMVFNMECIEKVLVVVGVDFNFTLGALKVWELTTQVDCLAGYFIKKLDKVDLLE
jgi:hypothetical protein